MSLINREFPFIQTYTEHKIDYYRGDQTPTSGLASLHEFVIRNDLWYCAITTEKCLSVFCSIKDLMGEEIYNRVLNKQAYVVIDLSFEPFLDVIDVIYEHVVNKYNIPAGQVIFMSNLHDAAKYNKEYSVRNNVEPIRIFYFTALEKMLYWEQGKFKSSPLKIKPYEKKFLNLNRRWRIHRPLLTILLYGQGLIDKGYVSFGPCEDNRDWSKVWIYLRSLADNNKEMLSIIDSSESIKNHPWWYLDTNELDTNRADLETSTDKFYENSYFSVVSETTFFSKNPTRNSRFITEKTFKAIVMHHPFILVTIPRTLEALRQLGYKTFHPYIDESYDLELDDNKRMMMILKEIERLSNLTETQLEEFLKNVIPITIHNYYTLRTKEAFIYEGEEQCIVA